MASIIALEQVEAIRQRIAHAHAVAAERFRDAFAASDLPIEERWRTHLQIQANALIESARGIRLLGAIHYRIDERVVQPYVEPGQPLHRFFDVKRTPEAIFEYWMLSSEIAASPSWSVTKVIATSSEFDAALRRMAGLQMVRALVVTFLPAVELHQDGSALLQVTLYTRAGEERIERRTLSLDSANELDFHSREVIAEGTAGVGV
jgi:hypothetical protein